MVEITPEGEKLPGRPPVPVRIAFLVAVISFFRMHANPLIDWASAVGIPPDFLDRALGARTVFTGLAEAFYRLCNADLAGAIHANPYSAPLALFLAIRLLTWRCPLFQTRRGIALLLGGVAVASATMNLPLFLL